MSFTETVILMRYNTYTTGRIMTKLTIPKLKKGLNNPVMAKRFIINKLSFFPLKLHELIDGAIYKYTFPPGIDIMEQDWDNLIILDACRFDTFNKINQLSGSLSSEVTAGYKSSVFMQKNFSGRQLHDTVYITSNPHVDKTLDGGGEFHHVIRSYEERHDPTDAEFSVEYHPENVFKTAKNSLERFNDKRLIIHFMQPHVPYFGPKASEYRDKVRREHNVAFRRMSESEVGKSTVLSDLKHAASKGYLHREELIEVYEENLRICLKYVERLVSELYGKTVITSDHGELLGDPSTLIPYHRFGHECKFAQSNRIVPWFIVDSEYKSRKNIIAERPIRMEDIDKEVVDQQLQELGYL